MHLRLMCKRNTVPPACKVNGCKVNTLVWFDIFMHTVMSDAIDVDLLMGRT